MGSHGLAKESYLNIIHAKYYHQKVKKQKYTYYNVFGR